MTWYKSLWFWLHGYRTNCRNVLHCQQHFRITITRMSIFYLHRVNLSTMATLETEESGLYGEMAVMGGEVGVYDTCFFRGEGGGTTRLECQAHDYHIHKTWILYVAQYPAGTGMRPLKTKTQFLRRPFQFSVNEVFWMKPEHFTFKMKVLASLQLAKQLQKAPICSGE